MKKEQTIFLETIRDVLEQFAFMFCESDDEKLFRDCQGPFLHVSITFSRGGRESGQAALSLTAPESMAVELAGNILGLDPAEVDADAGPDALKELINVVCGEVIPKLYGNKEVFDLTVPSLCRIDSGKWNELVADPDNLRLWVDDRPMLAMLTVANEV